MKKYKILLAISLIAIGLMSALIASINEKKAETKMINSVPQMDDRWESSSIEFRTHYPRQYDSWRKTIESDEIHDMLKEYPELIVMWAGYGFAKDYNAPRGHYYSVEDSRNTLRTGAPTNDKTGPMPTACWTCKSTDVPRLMEQDGDPFDYYVGKWARYGSEVVNPIGCIDCHNPKTMELEINRKYYNDGLVAAGMTDLKNATQQEMRSHVCAQCHVEYYFSPQASGDKKAAVVTLPWANGVSVEEIEKYYDDMDFKDWVHPISKTPMIKAQHPGYEMYLQGAHGKNNVSCADCHMPYTQEGGIKFSDHHVGNPLQTMQKSCMNCHKTSEQSLLANIAEKRERRDELHKKTIAQLSNAHLEAGKAWEVGATKEEMDPILTDIRHAQWRWDYALASHPAFFHAPEETLRVLGTALHKVGEARVKLAKVLAKHGAGDYVAPANYTKEEAQKIIGLPYDKLVEEKEIFNNGLAKEWIKEAEEKGLLNPKTNEGIKFETSYSK